MLKLLGDVYVDSGKVSALWIDEALLPSTVVKEIPEGTLTLEPSVPTHKQYLVMATLDLQQSSDVVLLKTESLFEAQEQMTSFAHTLNATWEYGGTTE